MVLSLDVETIDACSLIEREGSQNVLPFSGTIALHSLSHGGSVAQTVEVRGRYCLSVGSLEVPTHDAGSLINSR